MSISLCHHTHIPTGQMVDVLVLHLLRSEQLYIIVDGVSIAKAQLSLQLLRFDVKQSILQGYLKIRSFFFRCCKYSILNSYIQNVLVSSLIIISEKSTYSDACTYIREKGYVIISSNSKLNSFAYSLHE